ncbi:hypothetical protein L226DRAFT_236848 [Lentinus tigrinus ALCF2SS1-7]|uniref:Uncharacterized protein n=1 Tax=Lentinus tigrinus ALCF2SS1-6 TaxID=1328759 RepID=A0A5C2SP82_9APHY|nr:hypothetical protein L227DRAFT_607110 [Lentinus tigrinus ALCF2SS1-6]RPD78959.1 hypothetical protein L226DRAFT_236848 [Lentinus tigrinus ALCF2SS1-7]
MAPTQNPIPKDLDSTIGTANMVGIILSTVTYGVHLTLFIFLIRLYIDRSPYVVRSRQPPKPSWFPIIYATLLFVLATAGICLQVWINHDAFLVHRGFPGGPLAYMVATVERPGNMAVTAVYVVLNWCADGMLFYRFFALFRFSRFVLIVAAMVLVSLVGLGIVSMRNISLLSVNLWTDRSTVLSLAYLTLSLSINVTLTLAIVSRLIYFRHRLRNLKIYGDTYLRRMYTSVVAMFVESAALYTVVAISCIVAFRMNSPVQNALLPLLGQLQAIPPLLIAIRVLEYRVITPEAFPPSTPSAITFNTPLSITTQDGGSCIKIPSPCLCRDPSEIVGRHSLDVSSVTLGKSRHSYHSPCDSMSRSPEVLVEDRRLDNWDFLGHMPEDVM